MTKQEILKVLASGEEFEVKDINFTYHHWDELDGLPLKQLISGNWEIRVKEPQLPEVGQWVFEELHCPAWVDSIAMDDNKIWFYYGSKLKDGYEWHIRSLNCSLKIKPAENWKKSKLRRSN